ncbi:unnamed protein product [Phytomonas sp. Hart1]|nr:unnamed protein product [Phytomonas sp. Hart1]|eukprot:CCW70491.1 unnamed protein product [Phytomonas sp. isolate Hart1]
MKRVLVINGDSYVGKHVARTFYNSHEYEVEITLSRTSNENSLDPHNPTSLPLMFNHSPSTEVPPDMRTYVSRVVTSHKESPREFCQKVLENDIIIAILEDDAHDAECAAKVLLGSHYEVEKTYVLVSSIFTWAETLNSERAKVRAERRREAALERAAEREFDDDDADPAEVGAETRDAAPPDEDAEAEEYPDEELVPSRVFTEEDYAQRIPHPQYEAWKQLERLVKRANSETLHTYVLTAGLPYGDGEGPLAGLLHAAWRHYPLEPLFPARYDRFRRRRHRGNVVPMIHVRDLSAIIYRVGAAFEVLGERYLFAVDQGNCSVQQLLDALRAGFGDGVAWGDPPAISSEPERPAFPPLPPTTSTRPPLSPGPTGRTSSSMSAPNRAKSSRCMRRTAGWRWGALWRTWTR